MGVLLKSIKDSNNKYFKLSIAVAINFFLQFVFQWYILKVFGATEATDALFGAMALPQFILLVLTGSLTIVLIPFFSNLEKEQFRKEAWNYFHLVSIIFLVISIVLYFTVSVWIKWILPGFNLNSIELAISLSRIQLISMFLSSVLSILLALHSSKSAFLNIELTSIYSNLTALLILVILGKSLGIYVAAWALVCRSFLQCIFLMPILGPYQKPNFNSHYFKKNLAKVKPLLIGNIYYKTDSLVDRFLISSAPVGFLTLFNLGQQLYTIVSSIYVKVFIVTAVPIMSTLAYESNWEVFNQKFKRALVLTTIFSITTIILLILLGKPALTFVFSSKNFNADEIIKLWHLMLGLSGFWIGGLLGSVTSNTFYAKGNTKTPTIIGAILFTIYIPFKVILFNHVGIVGLVTVISSYYLLSVLIQAIFLKKHILFKK